MTLHTQMVMTPIEEDVLACRIRDSRDEIRELLNEIETRSINKSELMTRIKDVERKLRLTRNLI